MVDTAVLNTANHWMTGGIGGSWMLAKHRCECRIIDHEPYTPAVKEDPGGRVRFGPVPSCLCSELASLGMGRQGLKQLGACPAGESMVNVARERVRESTGQVAGQRTRIERAVSQFGRVPTGPGQGRQHGDMPTPERVRFRRRQVAHLHVVAEHGPVQPDEPRRESSYVGMLGGVAEKGRKLRIGVSSGCGGHTVTEPRGVKDGHLEVVAPLRSHGLHDGTEAACSVRQGNPSGSVGLLAERTEAPDVLRERPNVIDVFEALAN